MSYSSENKQVPCWEQIHLEATGSSTTSYTAGAFCSARIAAAVQSPPPPQYTCVLPPEGGYVQLLKKDGLEGKRIGVPNNFFTFRNGSMQQRVYQQHLDILWLQGAVVIENLDIENLGVILDSLNNGEQIALAAEFKLSLNSYLSDLSYSPVRSLAEVIAFNAANPVEEKLKEIGQLIVLVAENTTGIGATEKAAIDRLNKLSADGLEKLMTEHKLDAVVTPDSTLSTVLAIGGMPVITVPAGYSEHGVPFGLSFGGLRVYEPRLIEMAYAFEQVLPRSGSLPRFCHRIEKAGTI